MTEVNAAFRCALLGSVALAACAPNEDGGALHFSPIPGPSEVVLNEGSVWPTGQGWIVASEPSLSIGEENDERYQFSSIAAATRQSDGAVVLADVEASLVRLYGPDGRLRQSLGGPGSGPGEFQSPSDVLLGEDDAIVVWDDKLWRRTSFDRNGVYVDDRSFRPEVVWETTEPLYPLRAILMSGGGLLVVLGEKAKQTPMSRAFRTPAGAVLVGSELDSFIDLARFPGEEQVVVDSPWGPMPMVPALARQTLVARGRSSMRVCYGDQARREVRCAMADGPVRAIRWPEGTSGPGDRSSAVAAWRERTLEDYGQKLSSDDARRLVDEIPIAEPPSFDRMLLDEAGYLWVDLGPDEDGRTFLVFDEGGRLLGPVATPDIRVLEVGSDYLLGVSEDAFGVQRIRLHDLYRTVTYPESN